MIDAFRNRPKETIYIVMDLVEGPSLKTLVEEAAQGPIEGLPEIDCK